MWGSEKVTLCYLEGVNIIHVNTCPVIHSLDHGCVVWSGLDFELVTENMEDHSAFESAVVQLDYFGIGLTPRTVQCYTPVRCPGWAWLLPEFCAWVRRYLGQGYIPWLYEDRCWYFSCSFFLDIAVSVSPLFHMF